MIAIFQSKTHQNLASVTQFKKELNRLSVLRLSVFLVSLILILILANERAMLPLLLVVPFSMIAFGFVLNRYNGVAFKLRRVTWLSQINEQEISRLENNLSDFPTGNNFLVRDHPYLSDMDIFGAHSLFQLLNRATTESGQSQLADWLAKPVSKEIILKRQRAIQELAPNVDWRQDLQAAGMPFANSKSDYKKLLHWAAQPVQLLPKRVTYLAICIFLACLALSAGVYFLHHISEVLRYRSSFSITYFIPLLVTLTVNGLYLKKWKPISLDIVENLHQNVATLGGYQALISKIESEKFHADLLLDLQSAFRMDGYSAVTEIKRLKKILGVFMHRGTKDPVGGNVFYAIFNRFLLLDVHWILATEAWKNKNRTNLESWARAVGEFEAFTSLSGFAYSNPSFAFPQMSEEPYQIHFAELGHPLIHPSKRICNDFELRGSGTIVMITGSNMAGKSTFLRTVGINLVLAFMGAPCCISAGNISSMQLFTSMRTQDNLEEGVSSFYAELMRIEQLLKMIEGGKPVFFLLDEMFKGTNSMDRYKGGISLIKQLSELNAFGLISTHDIELAKTTSNYLPLVNYSFNSQIKDLEMVFDYKLTQGLCSDFNASELMRRSGIKLLDEIL